MHGLTRDKKESIDFVNIVANYDICFLYETWCNSQSDIELNGYLSHNLYRKYQHRKSKRNSGGIAIYYKEHLKDAIEIIKNHHNTIIWLKLDHNFFNVDQDIYICGSYIWGNDSPMYTHFNVDLFDVLENDISCYNNLGSVYIFGDFNSRVGHKSDFIVHDVINNCTDDIDYDPDSTLTRASSDNTHNSHGLKLLDLCKATGMRIVNGRLSNTHHYTFLSTSGCSVIDYLITDSCNFKQWTVPQLSIMIIYNCIWSIFIQ